MFKLNNIQLSYDKFSLNSGELAFQKGKIYCITGSNGAGKSTLLKIIGLQIKADCGELQFNGQIVDINDRESVLAHKREISFLLQNSHLFHRSVYENIAYGLKIRNCSKAEIKDKVNAILAKFEISYLAKRGIIGLSGGEAQRVRLARNLVIDAPVYILDEPSAGLDKRGRELLAEILAQYNKEKGSTIIFTSHHQEEAYRLMPELISVKNGRIVEIPRENVLNGFAKAAGEKLYRFYNQQIDQIFFSADHSIEGAVSLAIDPEEIILSATRVHTSARNCLAGTIKEIKSTASALQLTVNAGEDFTVLITKSALEELKLSIGSSVFLIFKATAVKVV